MLVYGPVVNVTLKLPVGPTMLSCDSEIPVSQGLKEVRAIVEFTFSPAVCRAVSKALKPEVLRSSEGFAQIKIQVDKEILKIEISSTDLASLRAGINSYFNLVRAASETISANS